LRPSVSGVVLGLNEGTHNRCLQPSAADAIMSRCG
jgi:hypothetical protein